MMARTADLGELVGMSDSPHEELATVDHKSGVSVQSEKACFSQVLIHLD